MKCESCNTYPVDIVLPENEGLEDGIWDTEAKATPYQLCRSCCERLKNMALRPLELFNLAAIHSHTGYLHDDFYDYDTGEACQPETDVVDADKYPFPTFEEVKNNLPRLIDYSFVQYFTEDNVICQLKQFNKAEILEIIDCKVAYNHSIAYKAYEIVAKVVGRAAEEWTKTQWQNREEGAGINEYAELIAASLPSDDAFRLITTELATLNDSDFANSISALLYMKSEKTLDWIENQTGKMKNIGQDWGQLAASSQFSWQRCAKWLKAGRPLSLIALDALYMCTLADDDYAAQSTGCAN
ncbi:hypothetical protein [Bacteroides sp. 224]|uniref:hypothetical protein n=1 Tax=Bacteroides sp. 224 TaxID=2302936 RepID=UPI0013D3BE83|nr:hypothetical protein [Bacteroides sp. 224]NDV66696.1 hypothetical protein [Bacteroides sp. 224]